MSEVLVVSRGGKGLSDHTLLSTSQNLERTLPGITGSSLQPSLIMNRTELPLILMQAYATYHFSSVVLSPSQFLIFLFPWDI